MVFDSIRLGICAIWLYNQGFTPRQPGREDLHDIGSQWRNLFRTAPSRTTLGIFLGGFLMGTADIIPGVSGGTMAFILGIYDELMMPSNLHCHSCTTCCAALAGGFWRLPLAIPPGAVSGIGLAVLSLVRVRTGHWKPTPATSTLSFLA
jgi:hypothetical protein